MKKQKKELQSLTREQWLDLYKSIWLTHQIYQERRGKDLFVKIGQMEGINYLKQTEKQFLVKNCKPLSINS